MRDFINKTSKMEYGYFELLGMIKADFMHPTRSAFDDLKAPRLHPDGSWKSPDSSDCHWPAGGIAPIDASKNGGGRRLWIRHDVDDRIDLAWEMALAEHERGIRAVYFFLHTAAYFRWGAFIRMIKDFAAAGHTIGIHNNAVASSYKHGDPSLADMILKRDLGYLRSSGAEIFITASHGDGWNRHHNILNYEMFSECRRSGVFPHKPLSEYGLAYEAYFTPHTCYLGDSGGRWGGFIRNGSRSSNPIDVVERFNAESSGVMQLLVHPQWWEVQYD